MPADNANPSDETGPPNPAEMAVDSALANTGLNAATQSTAMMPVFGQFPQQAQFAAMQPTFMTGGGPIGAAGHIPATATGRVWLWEWRPISAKSYYDWSNGSALTNGNGARNAAANASSLVIMGRNARAPIARGSHCWMRRVC